jgi:hypothetical protein
MVFGGPGAVGQPALQVAEVETRPEQDFATILHLLMEVQLVQGLHLTPVYAVQHRVVQVNKMIPHLLFFLFDIHIVIQSVTNFIFTKAVGIMQEFNKIVHLY